MPTFAADHAFALEPRNWRLIASQLPREVAPMERPELARWAARNQDRHAHVEVLVALRGEGWYSLDGSVYPLRPGTAVLFNAHEPHQSGYPDFAPNQDHLWLSIVSRQVSGRLLHIREGRPDPSAQWTRVVHQEDVGITLDVAAFVGVGNEETLPSVRRLRLAAILAAILAALQQPATTPDRDNLQERSLTAVRDHIHETAGNGASLEHLSRIAGYSKFHLHRLFKARYGETIQEYVDQCRRERVRIRLREGALKKQLAAELGFSCPAAFSRWLRRHSVS